MKVILAKAVLMLTLIGFVSTASPPRAFHSLELFPEGEEVGETLFWRGQNAPPAEDNKLQVLPSIRTVPDIVPMAQSLARRRNQSVFSKLKTAVHWPGSDWRAEESRNKMSRMIKYRPRYVVLDNEAASITENPIRVGHFSVIALPQGNLGQRVLSLMTLKGEPFLVEDSLGYVWLFTRKADGSYTYTSDLNTDTVNVVKEEIRKAANAVNS